jgi:predicted dehydrogenase
MAVDRRQFLHNTAALAASMAALQKTTAKAADETTPQPKKRTSPNEVVNVAIVGVHGRGMEHVRGFNDLDEARITTICDVDRNAIGRAMKAVSSKYGSEPEYVVDFRRLLDDKDIDVISIATPNHWHSLQSIWACQAGKDVYLEKPISHNVLEGRRAVEAAEKYNRVVQTGTQCRSHKGIQDAIEFLRSGKLGKIYMAKGLCYKPRGSIGHKPDGTVPAGLDYNLWLGPAPERPYNPNYVHYNWHWFWDFGNGDLGNQGIHQVDLARWGIGKNEFPKSVVATGGRFGYKDDGQTPNTLLVVYEFDDCEFQFEVRGLMTNDEAKVRIGDIFYGTEGILAITSYTTWQTYLGPNLEPGPGGSGSGDHFANFLQAVKSRDVKSLNAPLIEGHLSSAYCHLGNISYRLGRKLQINPSTESFVNDAEADAMLTRHYRAPFVVPDKV